MHRANHLPYSSQTVTAAASALAASDQVSDSVISDQRAKLAAGTQGKGYGPHAPRDIDDISGNNTQLFAASQSELQPGDTIEVHYVYTTAQVTPGPTLGACLSDAIQNPQLRAGSASRGGC